MNYYWNSLFAALALWFALENPVFWLFIASIPLLWFVFLSLQARFFPGRIAYISWNFLFAGLALTILIWDWQFFGNALLILWFTSIIPLLMLDTFGKKSTQACE
jgi:hypothetical protein